MQKKSLIKSRAAAKKALLATKKSKVGGKQKVAGAGMTNSPLSNSPLSNSPLSNSPLSNSPLTNSKI